MPTILPVSQAWSTLRTKDHMQNRICEQVSDEIRIGADMPLIYCSRTSVLTASELELGSHIARGSSEAAYEETASVAVGSQTHLRSCGGLHPATSCRCVASAGRAGADAIAPGTLLIADAADDVLVTDELAYRHLELCARRTSLTAVAGAPLAQHRSTLSSAYTNVSHPCTQRAVGQTLLPTAILRQWIVVTVPFCASGGQQRLWCRCTIRPLPPPCMRRAR